MTRLSDLEALAGAGRALSDRLARLEAAVVLCVEWMRCGEVHNWPPGWRLREEAWMAASDALGDVAPAWLRVAVERVRRTAVSALSPPPARGEGQEKTMDKKGGTNG